MLRCDRCGDGIPISTADPSVDDGLTKEQLRDIHEPTDDPFTIIEGAFAVWTADFDIEQRGAFPLLLCRNCTAAFVDWVDDPDVTPTERETRDHSLDLSYTDS